MYIVYFMKQINDTIEAFRIYRVSLVSHRRRAASLVIESVLPPVVINRAPAEEEGG